MAQRLLLADDSITIQKVVELVLAEEGFDIKATGNGEDAFQALSAFKPDVVLADVDMPRMNGYQLCEKIKTNPETSKVPVILMAGAFEPLDEDLAKSVGADDHIVKPFESQELISKINAVLFTGEVAPDVPEAMLAEAVEPVEAPAFESDMWAVDEIPSEPAAAGPSMETPFEEAAGPGVFELADEVEPEVETPPEPVEPVIKKSPPEPPRERPAVARPEVEVISKEEVAAIFRKEIGEKVSSLLASSDVKDLVLSSVSQSVKDSVEKVLWEIAPDLSEKLLKQMLGGAMASLTKEVEKVIWETVPDLAERLISKEIEKIKSEI